MGSRERTNDPTSMNSYPFVSISTFASTTVVTPFNFRHMEVKVNSMSPAGTFNFKPASGGPWPSIAVSKQTVWRTFRWPEDLAAQPNFRLSSLCLRVWIVPLTPMPPKHVLQTTKTTCTSRKSTLMPF